MRISWTHGGQEGALGLVGLVGGLLGLLEHDVLALTLEDSAELGADELGGVQQRVVRWLLGAREEAEDGDHFGADQDRQSHLQPDPGCAVLTPGGLAGADRRR